MRNMSGACPTTDRRTAALLQVPPFPGARRPAFGRRATRPHAIPEAELERLVDRALELRINGEYWCAGGHRTPGGEEAEADRERMREAVTGFDYCDPFTGDPIDPADAIELCGFWRGLVESNRDIRAAVGFGAWKQETVAPLLWDGSNEVPFTSEPRSVAEGDTVAVWKARTPAKVLERLQSSGATLVEVEDGFIRSVGLGADCVPPLSVVVDRSGIYFDPGRPSDLETLLQTGSFDAVLLERARALRKLIVETGVTKYATGRVTLDRRVTGKRHLLVPGQVEDDRSVQCGGGEVRTNLELLRRVRTHAPDAYVSFKPHPDVEAGHRTGAIADKVALQFADEVVRDQPICSLMDIADEVHVNTSLAGFEALLRSMPVTTYGVPFYAGWGLTTDLGPVPARRSTTRSLDELVAAALLLYPRYLDPVTNLPCPPEVLLQRLRDGMAGDKVGTLVRLRRLEGKLKRAASALRMWR